MKLLPYLIAVLVLGSLSATAEQQPKSIHVFVALCDNDSQGIVPVPAALGNGDDPANNLYWGAMYGVRTFFKKSGNWTLVADIKGINDTILERLVFRHRSGNAYLIADAYRGNQIKTCVESFLQTAGGNRPALLKAGDLELGLYGNADLIAYIGHNGLMDFSLESPASNKHRRKSNEAIVLACRSQPYFEPLLENARCKPLLLTTGFMAPEAYTLDAALEAWLAGKNAGAIRRSAAEAYNKYQKCGINGAMRLFSTSIE